MPPPQSKEPSTRRGSAQSPSRVFLKIGIAAAGVVCAVFAGQFWLEAYLKSEAFRIKIEEALGRSLHAKAQLSEIRRQGTTITSESLRLEGSSGSFFKSAQIHGLRAELDLGGLWQRLWKVDHLSFLSLELNLDAPAKMAKPVEAGEERLPAKPESFLASLLPNKTKIASLQSDRTTITRAGVEVLQTRSTASPQDSGWNVVLGGGELHCPGVPRMEIQEARLQVTPEGGTLRGARLLIKTGGQMTLTGEWSAASGTKLHAQIENTSVTPFLPQWWQAKLHGSLQGTVHLTQPGASNAGSPELSGDLRLAGGKLEGLPLLGQLDGFLGSPRFRQVALKTASARLRKTSDRTELQDIDLDAEGILRIRGGVSVERDRLSGSLRLGISPSFVQWLPAGRNALFGEPSEGYVWVPFQLSGSLENPQEDLSTRLAAGVVDAVTEAAKGLPKELPKALPEAAKGLLDAVKSILPGR